MSNQVAFELNFKIDQLSGGYECLYLWEHEKVVCVGDIKTILAYIERQVEREIDDASPSTD